MITALINTNGNNNYNIKTHGFESFDNNIGVLILDACLFVFNKLSFLLGLIGVIISAILLFPFLLIAMGVLSFSMRRIYKGTVKLKKQFIPTIEKLSYSEIKVMEDSLTKTYSPILDLEKKIEPLKKIFLFRKMHFSIENICINIKDIRKQMSKHYTISKDELSEEQRSTAMEYWSKVKTSNPKMYNIIKSDSSGEQVIFSQKRRKHAQYKAR